jgi:hypothetical protein
MYIEGRTDRQRDERMGGQSCINEYSAGMRVNLEANYTMLFLMRPEFSNLTCNVLHVT